MNCPVPAMKCEATQNHLAFPNGFSMWPGLHQFPRLGGTYMAPQGCSVLAASPTLQIRFFCFAVTADDNCLFCVPCMPTMEGGARLISVYEMKGSHLYPMKTDVSR